MSFGTFKTEIEWNILGSPFTSSLVRTMIAAVIWISLLSYSLYYHWANGVGQLYIIRPLHIFFAFFFPTFYSRNKIMHRLNASYLLLKETQFSNNITVPLLFIFSPLIVYIFMMVSFTIPGEHRRILEFFAFLSIMATFTIKSSICSNVLQQFSSSEI